MATKIIIAELDIDSSALLKNTTALKKQIQDLKDEQKALSIVGQENSELYVQNAVDVKALTSAYNTNIKALSESSKAQQDQATRLTLIDEVLNKEITTIREAREQNALLNKLRNDANLTTAEGQAEVVRLNTALDKNNEFIKENADQYLQQKINIGNYSEGMKDALNQMNPLNGGLTGFISRSQEAGGVMPLLSNGLKAVTIGIGGMIKASLAFIATPIGAIIAVLGVVLGGLITYLKSTQEGIDKITAITRPLQAIMQSLFGVLQQVGKALFDAFSNPKQLLTDLADFIKTNLINRFTAFGVILDGIINLDFKKITDGVLQAGTGVENLTDKIGNVANATTKFLDESIKKGQEIDALTKQIEQSEISLNKEREIGNTKIKELDRIAKDTSANFKDRLKANEEQNRLAQETADKEQVILNLKIRRLKVQQSLNDTSREENKELADLEAELERSKQRVIEEELKGVRVIAQARKEEIAKQKEAREKAIALELNLSKQRIDLFIAEQGFMKKSTEETYLFNKQLLEKELKDLELRYKKGTISKLEYETEKLNISNDFLQKNSELLIAEGQRELEIIKSNAQIGLDAKLEAERVYQDIRLENGEINEREYQDKILEIENEYTQLRLDKKLQDEAYERDRVAINLENERANQQLTFEQDVELQKQQNEIRLTEELLQAEKSGADTQLIKDKYAKLDEMLTKSVEDNKLQLYSQTFSALSSIFGEQSKLGKAFAIYQASIDTYRAISGQLAAFSGVPIPGYAVVQAVATGAVGFRNVAKIAGAKFEKGGIQEIGGSRHSQGGTKFYGEDGTTFEAEKGEGIGILNRGAYSTFMDFNNRFGSGSSNSGFFQGGGIITQGVRNESLNIDSVVDAISNMPAPRVAVDEIQSVGVQYTKVINSANLG